MTNKYIPRKQGAWGQAFDCVFILVAVYACLLLPLLLGGGANTHEVADASAHPTWESLEQNEAMVQQWKKLDMDAEQAAKLINTRFDYTINWGWLIFTALVLIGYFAMLILVSRREYKEVINEAFGERR